MMSKRLLALALAGGLAAGCSDPKWSLSSLWKETKTTVSDAAESLTQPDPDEGAAQELAEKPVDVPKDVTECVERGKAHQRIESYNIRITSTILKEDPKAAVATANNGRDPDEVLHVGEYIGRKCWRVREISHDFVLLEQPYKDDSGVAQARTMQVDFEVKPPKELHTQQ